MVTNDSTCTHLATCHCKCTIPLLLSVQREKVYDAGSKTAKSKLIEIKSSLLFLFTIIPRLYLNENQLQIFFGNTNLSYISFFDIDTKFLQQDNSSVLMKTYYQMEREN